MAIHIDDSIPELTFGAVQVSNKGARSASLREYVKFNLDTGEPLRMPFGKPKNFDESKTDRASCNFSCDSPALETWAKTLDTKIQEAAKKAGLATGNYCPIFKPSKKEGYQGTVSAKFQLEGLKRVRCWTADKQRIEYDAFDWHTARVVPILQLRGIWPQGHQYGPSIEVVHMLVHPDESGECPFEV